MSGDSDKTKEDLLLEIARLKERLRESEELLCAIREGKIDALVSYEPEGERVYTLETADRGYRLLVESIDEGAVILAPEGSIYYANPRFEAMLKESSGKLTGSFLSDRVHEADRPKLQTVLDKASRGRTARGEIRLEASDGTLLPVAIASSSLEIKDFCGICVTFTDLTEQKLYIERLERSNRELQDFASIASHDLQEPLRKIQAFGERLKAKGAGSLSPEGKDYLDRMQKASKRMQSFIQELLSYSRVTTRAAPFLPVDLGAVIEDVLGDLQVRLDETGGTVRIGDFPALEADPGQMRQLFLNLIGNALKFHGKERPVVTIHGRIVDGAGKDAFAKGDSGRICRIVVEDNGIGFDEANAERIFAPFQRLHGRSAYEGTGMGLAICKKIVERHGGAITAKSTSGKGSRFIVTLPLRQHQEEEG